MKNVAFIYTNYQYQVLNSSREFSGVLEKFYIIKPSGLMIKGFSYGDVLLEYSEKPRKGHGFLSARSLIKEIKHALCLEKFSSYRLWLASDDNPAAQILINYHPPDEIYLLEDGIGSYLDLGFLCRKGTLRQFLAKIKNLIFYFPFYRSWRMCGSLTGNSYFAYSSLAFPLQTKKGGLVHVVKQEISQNLVVGHYFPPKSCLFIGQPIYSAGVGFEDYMHALSTAFNYLKDVLGVKDIYYKPHPKKDIDKLGFYNFFDNEARVFYLDNTSQESLENYYFSISPENILTASFLSTALLNIKRVEGSASLVSFYNNKLKEFLPYYSVLRSFDICVIKI